MNCYSHTFNFQYGTKSNKSETSRCSNHTFCKNYIAALYLLENKEILRSNYPKAQNKNSLFVYTTSYDSTARKYVIFNWLEMKYEHTPAFFSDKIYFSISGLRKVSASLLNGMTLFWGEKETIPMPRERRRLPVHPSNELLYSNVSPLFSYFTVTLSVQTGQTGPPDRSDRSVQKTRRWAWTGLS